VWLFYGGAAGFAGFGLGGAMLSERGWVGVGAGLCYTALVAWAVGVAGAILNMYALWRPKHRD
jgi:hypothetical protein